MALALGQSGEQTVSVAPFTSRFIATTSIE
jgi:hypothetical protein